MDFVNEKILSAVDINLLREVSNNLRWQQIYQHYNIFGGEIALAEGRSMSKRTGEFSMLDPIIRKYRKHLQLDDNIKDESYFLNYTAGSFARTHSDLDTLYTVVTVVEIRDLVGGETIVTLPYNRPEEGRMSNLMCNRNKEETKKPPYNQNIITSVIHNEEGYSMIYGSKLLHGVSQIVQGSRKVFVTWFKNE